MANRVYDTLTNIAACLCAEVEEADGPDLCFCGVIPGDAVVAEYAGDCDSKCGMAWVRLITAYPSVAVGQQSLRLGNCGNQVGFEVEMGILRCIPMDEEPLEPEELAAATDQQITDMSTMRRAITCCDSLSSKDFILGPYAPSGPLGGLVGGTWTIYLTI